MEHQKGKRGLDDNEYIDGGTTTTATTASSTEGAATAPPPQKKLKTRRDFLDLPQYILQDILSYLTAKQLTTCALASKGMAKACADESLWFRLCVKKFNSVAPFLLPYNNGQTITHAQLKKFYNVDTWKSAYHINGGILPAQTIIPECVFLGSMWKEVVKYHEEWNICPGAIAILHAQCEQFLEYVHTTIADAGIDTEEGILHALMQKKEELQRDKGVIFGDGNDWDDDDEESDPNYTENAGDSDNDSCDSEMEREERESDYEDYVDRWADDERLNDIEKMAKKMTTNDDVTTMIQIAEILQSVVGPIVKFSDVLDMSEFDINKVEILLDALNLTDDVIKNEVDNLGKTVLHAAVNARAFDREFWSEQEQLDLQKFFQFLMAKVDVNKADAFGMTAFVHCISIDYHYGSLNSAYKPLMPLLECDNNNYTLLDKRGWSIFHHNPGLLLNEKYAPLMLDFPTRKSILCRIAQNGGALMIESQQFNSDNFREDGEVVKMVKSRLFGSEELHAALHWRETTEGNNYACGSTLLHLLVSSSAVINMAFLQMLVEAGLDPDAKDDEGYSARMLAAEIFEEGPFDDVLDTA